MELKEAIDILKKEFNSSMFNTRYAPLKEAGMTLISLAETADKLSGIMPKEKEHYVMLDTEGEEFRTPREWEKKGYNQARTEILAVLADKLVNMQKDMPPEYSKLVNEHFWELI